MKKIISAILILIIAGAGFYLWFQSNKEKSIIRDTELSSRQVALLCTTDMATKFHIHPNLTIVINGVNQVIPADIGITATCMHSLHTHDDTGTLHVEAPVEKDFTLGDFFTIWEKPFSSDQILDFQAEGPVDISVTVNGIAVDTFENTILHDKDEIVIRAMNIKG